MKKKVLIVTGSLLGKGGAEKVILNFVKYFHDDVNIDILVSDLYGENLDWIDKLRKYSNYVYVNSRSKTGNKLKRFFWILKSAKASNPNLIIATTPKMILMMRVYLTLCRKKTQLVSWMQVSISSKFSPRIAKLLILADKHFAIASGVQKQLIDLGINKNKIKLVLNPVERQRTTILPEKKETVFLYIARIQFRRDKNMKELLDACRRLSGNWRLHVFGTDDNNGTDVRACKEYAHKLGISENIVWFGWENDPWEKIKHADALVLSSTNEGFGLVLAEAISYGIPVVSANCPIGPEEIVNVKNGFLYPMGDDEILSNYMQKFIDKTASFDSDIVKESIEKMYEENYIKRFNSILHEWL